MTHYTLLQLPHGALNPLLSSRSPHQDAEDTPPPGPTAGLAICAVIPDATPADDHPDTASQSVYDSASEDTTPPYTREYVADLRRRFDEAERQLVALRGDAERVRDEQAEEQREAQAELVTSRIEAQRVRDEQADRISEHVERTREEQADRTREEQADRISELTWELSIRDACIRELKETNARLETVCATLAASRDRLSDVVDELSAERADLEDIVEERQRRVEEQQRRVEEQQRRNEEQQRRVEEQQRRVEELERQGRALEASNNERLERIQALDASKAELQEKYATLKENMSKAVKKHKEMTEAQTVLEARVTALTASNEERATRISSLETQICNLEAVDATSKQRIEKLSKSCEDKEQTITQLRHELAALASVMKEAKSENAALMTANRDLQSTTAQLESEHASAKAELDSLRLEKARAEAAIGGLEFALSNKESRVAQLKAAVASLGGRFEAARKEAEAAMSEADAARAAADAASGELNATNEHVAQLSEEREMLASQLADAHVQIEALREPPLASDEDIAGVLGEINQAMCTIAEDIAAHVVPMPDLDHVPDLDSATGSLGAEETTQLAARLRSRLGPSLFGALTQGDGDARRAVLSHALRAILAHWVRGVVGRWSLTDDEENLALRRMYEKIVQNYDPQVAGKWRSLALRVSSRAEGSLCAALESLLLESLAAVLFAARFERGPRDDAGTLDALVESLVWKVAELREHIGVVVTDRELALVLPRPGDHFDEATMQITPAASVAPPQEVEGDSEKGRAGGVDVVDESSEGDLVAEVSCAVALGLVRYQGTAALTVMKSRVLQR
ncbi:hypothetical protein FB107DRAFT_277297 [Schizophyllum commune]